MVHTHKTLPHLQASVFVTDPVCGMTIDPAAAAGSVNHQGKTYHFCSSHCETKFRKNPEQFVKEPFEFGDSEDNNAKHGCCRQTHKSPNPQRDTSSASRAPLYTCPMHPEIEQTHPGDCPICGMSLEPKTATAVDEDNSELTDMTRRLWIGGLLTLPVFMLLPENVPKLRDCSAANQPPATKQLFRFQNGTSKSRSSIRGLLRRSSIRL